MPHYSIRHITRYRYDAPVRENLTEARMQPRSEDNQRCLRFSLSVVPYAETSSYMDFLGNVVHTFDIPATHVDLHITAEALVEVNAPASASEDAPPDAWDEFDLLRSKREFWDYLHPSRHVQPTPLLLQLMAELNVSRERPPLAVLEKLSGDIYSSFKYAPQSTRVDSPIDEAITARKGVCQDLAHIMIAAVRQLGIPCRYVSGYLYHRRQDHDRSAEDATHAWLEAYLPGPGWVGFDPTNNLMATDRHIRVAVGRDYSDVPPSRGVYVGSARESLDVGVRVTLADAPPVPDDIILPESPWSPPVLDDGGAAQQQQQQ
ncbi:MAG: transglutaminase N-terminal domain-containing protein [Caldilineaceae bacterium]